MPSSDTPRPIATCSFESCRACDLFSDVTCHFRTRDTLFFWLLAAPSLLLGGAGSFLLGRPGLLAYLFLLAGYFGFLEIRVMCSHCPHYAEPGSSLRCWANYGSPKLWAYRPGPMSGMEKILFLGGMGVVYGYPFVGYVAGREWFHMLVYAVCTAGFLTVLRAMFCTRCMNFACPLNRVTRDIRESFLDKNPAMAGAWRSEAPGGDGALPGQGE